MSVSILRLSSLARNQSIFVHPILGLIQAMPRFSSL